MSAAAAPRVAFRRMDGFPGWRAEPQLAGGPAATTAGAPAPLATLVSIEPLRSGELPAGPSALFSQERDAGYRDLRGARMMSVGLRGNDVALRVACVAAGRILPFLLPVSAAIARPTLRAAMAPAHLRRHEKQLLGTSIPAGPAVRKPRALLTSSRLRTRNGWKPWTEAARDIRTGDEVVCYLPASLTVKIDKQPGRRPFPRSFRSSEGRSRTTPSGRARSSGSGATGARSSPLEPKDRMRYGHRLWADPQYRHAAQGETFDRRNELVEQLHSRSSRSAAPSAAIS